MHANSLIAYQENLAKLDKRSKMIYGHVAMKGLPMTDRQIKNDLFGLWADMNMVRPRISDMKRDGWMIEVGQEKGESGKLERLVWIVTPEERATGKKQMEMGLGRS